MDFVVGILLVVGVLGSIVGVLGLFRPTEQLTRKHAGAALGVGLILLVSGVDLFRASKFFEAVGRGDSEGVRLLLALGADVNQRDSNGRTALMVAVTFGDGEMVRHLLAAGADVNLPNSDGHTPLLHAVVMNHRDIVRQLLTSSADIDLDVIREALMVAATLDRREIARLLRKARATR